MITRFDEMTYRFEMIICCMLWIIDMLGIFPMFLTDPHRLGDFVVGKAFHVMFMHYIIMVATMIHEIGGGNGDDGNDDGSGGGDEPLALG